MPFGQLVVGPPGSGKTTYCAGLQQFFALTGRKLAIVNLDPANDAAAYDAAVDLGELVSLEAVQRDLGLGPNGGLVYCIEYLERNLDWLRDRLAPLAASGHFFLFDCPGQVELFTLAGALRRVVAALTDEWHYRLVAVQLVDAHLCGDPSKYLAALLLSLSTMLQLELPQVNLLSKFDLVAQYGELAFSPDFYLQAQGLERLGDAAAAGLPPRFARLTRALCDLVDDFALLQFAPLAIEDRESVAHAVALADKACGYVFAGLGASGGGPHPELQYSAGRMGDAEDLWQRMQEKYAGAGAGAGQRRGGMGERPRAGASDEDDEAHRCPPGGHAGV
jgi:hypothetical protein